MTSLFSFISSNTSPGTDIQDIGYLRLYYKEEAHTAYGLMQSTRLQGTLGHMPVYVVLRLSQPWLYRTVFKMPQENLKTQLTKKCFEK